MLYFILCIAIAGALAISGFSKKSLSLSGSITAFLVGFTTLFTGLAFGAVLIGFYASSSKLTKFKQERKQKLTSPTEFKDGGQRDVWQVLSNSFTATLICATFYWKYGSNVELTNEKINLIAAFLGFYSCCNADTWASELGMLSKSDPIMITSFKRVPPGTNGGVSLIGLIASVLGGAFIGFLWVVFSAIENGGIFYWDFIFLSLVCGLIGSLIDSLLGATIQYSGFSKNLKVVLNHKDKNAKSIGGADILTNNQVNFVSATLTSIIASGLVHYLFY